MGSAQAAARTRRSRDIALVVNSDNTFSLTGLLMLQNGQRHFVTAAGHVEKRRHPDHDYIRLKGRDDEGRRCIFRMYPRYLEAFIDGVTPLPLLTRQTWKWEE